MTKLALNLQEAAEAASVSEPTMRMLVNQDDFPALRIGRRWMIPVESFNAWLVDRARNRASIDGPSE